MKISKLRKIHPSEKFNCLMYCLPINNFNLKYTPYNYVHIRCVSMSLFRFIKNICVKILIVTYQSYKYVPYNFAHLRLSLKTCQFMWNDTRFADTMFGQHWLNIAGIFFLLLHKAYFNNQTHKTQLNLLDPYIDIFLYRYKHTM